MPDIASLDALVARIRSTNYSDPNDLANVIAVGLSAIARQQTFNRGLHDNTIAGVYGGTTFSAEDNSAGKVSTSLMQPATLKMQGMGAVATRQQGRADQQVRTLPSVVTAVEGTTANPIIKVAVLGQDGVATQVEKSTGQLAAGDPLGNINDYGKLTGQVLTLAGNPFATQAGDVDAQQIPVVGQTLMVSVADTSEKRTIWVNRNRRNYPRVITYPAVSGAATMVNGLCCHEPGSDPGGPGGT